MCVCRVKSMTTVFVLLFSSSCWAIENVREIALVDDGSQTASYTYSPGDRRDPFQPRGQLMQVVKSQQNVHDASRGSNADWKILGIISGSTGMQAVLRHAKGQRYIVSLGDVLTPSNLRVVHLTNTTVSLESFAGQNNQTQHFIPQTIKLIFK